MTLRIFTDGACSKNPGPGGWACLFLLPEEARLISSGVNHTTNNRMELLAVLRAMQLYIDEFCWMDIDKVEIYSDSAYVVNSINLGWVARWEKYSWFARKGQLVRNVDLWRKFSSCMKKIDWLETEIEFHKVAGHAGIEFNEIVDKAARGEVDKILADKSKNKGDK